MRMARIALSLLGALALIVAGRQTWQEHHRAAGLDFYIYWVNAQLPGRADVDNIYSIETQERAGEEYYARGQESASELLRYDSQRRRRLDNVSSPFLYTTFRWLSRDYESARTTFLVATLVAFVAATLLSVRAVGVRWAWGLYLVAALLTWFRGFEADLRVGNVNSFQFLVVAVIATLLRRDVAFRNPGLLHFTAGALGGMLLAFKPNVLYAVVLLLAARAFTRHWRELRFEAAGGIAGGLIAMIITAINYGTFQVWLQWPAAASQFWHRLQTRTERNVAPALSLIEQYGSWLSHLLAAVLIVIACVAIWRGRNRIDVLLIAGTGLLIYLLASTVVWLHYMVLTLPVAIALLQWRSTAVVSLLALAAIAEEPFEILTGKAIYPFDAHLITPALVALFLCAVWKIGWPASAVSDAGNELERTPLPGAQASVTDNRSSFRALASPLLSSSAGASRQHRLTRIHSSHGSTETP
jgi:hypothetical protein